MKLSFRGHFGFVSAALLAVALAACTQTGPSTTKPALDGRPTIRIAAGCDAPVKDANGVTWAADSGAVDGQTIQRPDQIIKGTKIPEIYHNERYQMTAYSFAVPNGKYKVNLHFSEDYDGNTTEDARIFDYAIRDGEPTGTVLKEVKDFSPWKASKGWGTAYVDSYDATITKGHISITFVQKSENPQINAIEIIPQ
jgi:hypothetical protein